MKKKCHNCKKNVTILHSNISGIRLFVEKNGKKYYKVKCSECDYIFYINK